jgi:4a-hydroxytetrahydrobiopterin dehydratase
VIVMTDFLHDDATSCAACRGELPRLTGRENAEHLRALDDWHVVSDHHLEKEWTFADFAGALRFVQVVAAVCEEHGHHPEILLAWGRARVTLWTLAVDGLTAEDFRIATLIDTAARRADHEHRIG